MSKLDDLAAELELKYKTNWPTKELSDIYGLYADRLRIAIKEERKLCEKKKFDNNLSSRVTLVCAFRYALGRQTYVVKDVQETICDNIEIIPVPTLVTIHNELVRYMEENNDAQWILFETYLENEIKRREGNDKSTEEKADRAVDGPGGPEAGPQEA